MASMLHRRSQLIEMQRSKSQVIDDDEFLITKGGKMGTKGYKTPAMPLGTVRTIRGDMLKIMEDSSSTVGKRKKAVIRDITEFYTDEPWKKLMEINVLKIEDETGTLTDFPSKVWNLAKIEVLVMTLTRMNMISKTAANKLKQMPRLSQLYMPENRLKTIAGVENVSSLVILNVNRNFLLTVPIDLGKLSYLRQLHLAGNRLKILPDSIGRLENLKELDVGSNKIDYLPETIGGMQSLEIIDISYNQITAIPDGIGYLSKLKEIFARGNKISKLPSDLSGLTSLHHIFLSHNNFRDVPASLGGIPNLQSLNMSHNLISTMHAVLPNASSLLLDKNRFESFPEAIPNCKRLEVLSLQENSLSNISPKISRLTRLRVLYLGGNKITKVPDELAQLNDLRHLTLNDTDIETLPLDLPRLRKLSLLDLEDTKVTPDIESAYLKDGIKGVQDHLSLKKKMSTKNGRLSMA